MARQSTESTEATTNTPEPTVADFSCRNYQSIFMNDARGPPCTHHPTGTLKYIWHRAYDHLLAGTENRKNTYVVLLGDEIKAQYGILCNLVADEFDKNRNIWLDLDLESEAATEPNSALTVIIIEHAGRLPNDALWHQKDDTLYIDLALSVFIRDSHHHWMKRSKQSGASQHEDARSTIDSNIEPGSTSRRGAGREVQSKRRQLLRDAQQGFRPPNAIRGGATLASAINIDGEDEADAISQAQDEDNIALTAIAPASSLASITSSTPLWQIQELISKLENENCHLRSENNSLSSRSFTAQSEAARLRQQVDQMQAESDHTLTDNAYLGIALAQRVGIRRNSAAAVRSDLAVRTSLTRDVTARLLENEGFTGRWFRGR